MAKNGDLMDKLWPKTGNDSCYSIDPSMYGFWKSSPINGLPSDDEDRETANMFTKKTEIKPVIPNKDEQFPANHVPPKGARFYAAVPSPQSQWWDVWGITVKADGDLESKKVAERLPYDLARIECGKHVIDAQMEYVK